MDELYLDNIDEYVTDQNKIVTYKWLSLTLGVHVNQAKQMLYDYVERKRKENSGAQLHVTYLVTGKHVQNGYPFHKVAIVKEEKLEAVKSKLAVIGSVHVYSIQRAVLKDSGPLFSTDYDIIKANLEICSKFSAIHCAFAVRRAPAEISKPQNSSQESSEHQSASAPIANGHGPPPSAKTTAQPPKGIMGMFAAKPNSKSQTTSKDSKPEVKEVPASTASSKATTKSNTVNNFFGKASMKKKASSEVEQMVKEEKPDPQPPSPEPETKVSIASTVEKPAEKSTEKPVGKPASKAEPAPQPKKGKKSKGKHTDLSDSDEENTIKKKRRRIKKPQSESSEDEAAPVSPAPVSPAAREERSPSPPSPEPTMKAEPDSQPAEVQTTGKKRKRRRVLKSNTFMDEEGCIVTEKTYQSESCTDSEGESSKAKLSAAPKQSAPAAVKREPKASKKAIATTSKGVKQSSIMGFFQKK